LAADLTTNWISLLTNAAPFTFTQSNASSFSQRFYHAKIWWENLGLRAKAGAERFVPAFFYENNLPHCAEAGKVGAEKSDSGNAADGEMKVAARRQTAALKWFAAFCRKAATKFAK
jgi:hypothetical protein